MALEQLFHSDQLSTRSMRHWLRADNGILLVACEANNDKAVLGYILVIMRSNSRSARLYSLVRSSAAKGKGIGASLLLAGEQEAIKAGCSRMRLEVAKSNHNAINLYSSLHYAAFETIDDYYEDGESAIRMQKNLK